MDKKEIFVYLLFFIMPVLLWLVAEVVQRSPKNISTPYRLTKGELDSEELKEVGRKAAKHLRTAALLVFLMFVLGILFHCFSLAVLLSFFPVMAVAFAINYDLRRQFLSISRRFPWDLWLIAVLTFSYASYCLWLFFISGMRWE